MSVRESQRHLLFANVTNANTKEGKKLIVAAPVDEAETVEFVNAGGEFPILDVGEPSMGDAVLLIVLFFGNVLAEPLHFTRGQPHTNAFGSEPPARFRARCRRQHGAEIVSGFSFHCPAI